MVSTRFLTDVDRSLVEEALKNDPYHVGTTADFYYAPRTVCSVIEDEHGPVFFLRGTPALRLDLQFVSQTERRRNAEAMLTVYGQFENNFRSAGFCELITIPSSTMLRAFCERRMGYQNSPGEMRKLI